LFRRRYLSAPKEWVVMKTPSQIVFQRRLRRVRHIWQAGLVLRLLVWLSGQALVVGVAAVLLDRGLALEPRPRIMLMAAAAVVWGSVCLFRFAAIAGLAPRQTAKRADRLLADRRQPILSAWELARCQPPAGTALQLYLTDRMVEHASQCLGSVRWTTWFPGSELATQLKILFLQAALASCLFLTFPNAATTILARWRYPGRDDPPYSRYSFTIAPANLRVTFGDDLDLTVSIDGAPVEAPVWLLTRYGGNIHRVVCFQDGDGRFAQRIERVVDPVECAFAIGRARSAWQPVELLLQPRVALARIEMQPPAYSGIPPRRFLAGQEALHALPGTGLRLEITSNRPLHDGRLILRPRTDPAAEQVVYGERIASHTIAFDWILTEAADIEAVIRDGRGTAAVEPLRLRQSVRPDLPPEVAITEPVRYVKATPRSRLPLAGYAADDLGLQRVDLLRSLVGFRDRVMTLGPDTVTREFGWETILDLAPLGVEPGETLELALEALDTNPNLLGVAASAIVRIEIISEADYARMLQDRTTLQAFVARFRVVESALSDVVAKLAALEAAMRDPDASPQQRAALQTQVVDAMRQTEDLYAKLADDFPIFAAEKQLAAALHEILATLRTQRSYIDDHTLEPPDRLARTAQRAQQALAAGTQSLREQRQDAETVAAAARIMAQAGRYMQLYSRQTELVQRLQRFEQQVADGEIPFLQALGRRQDLLRIELEAIRDELREAAQALPDDSAWDEWRDSARAFAELITTLEIAADMQAAAASAQQYRGPGAYLMADQARAKMQQILNQCQGTPMAELCQGMLPGGGSSGTMQPTLEQMMAAMLRRFGRGARAGEGGSGGAGTGLPIGGAIGDGYWMGGYSPLNTQVYGPDRMLLENSGDGSAEAWHSLAGGSGHGDDARRSTAATGSIAAERQQTPRGEARAAADPPPRYRDAIHRYFSQD